MKVAVSCEGTTLDSPVDLRFGRAAYFLVVDTATMTFQVVENENVAAAGGAGVNSGKTVIDAGAEAVLTGNCGPNAVRTLKAGGVKLFTGVSGSVAEAVAQFNEGKLTEAAGPSVESHFGTGG